MAVHSRSLLTAALIAGATVAPADIIDWKTVDGWDISFYPGSAGCQAFALFEENTAFFIGYDSTENQLSLDVTILDESWASIEDGTEYPIKLRFGDESAWTLNMDGVRLDGYPGLNIMIDATSAEARLFIEEFQHERSMEWRYQKTVLGRYTLSGSRKAFDEVIACQRSYTQAMTSDADPFAASPASDSDSDPFSQ